MDLWEKLDADARARLGSMLYRWKAVSQVAPRLALSLIRRKLSATAVLQFVYRTGAHALEDWGTLLGHALDSATLADALPQLCFASQLKADFLRCLLLPRHAFSLPALPPVDALAALEGVKLMGADAALHAAAQGLPFLQVVEANLRRRKAVRTDSARKWRGVWLPVYVQSFVGVSRQGAAVESVTLRP